jgi:hypothetical protein
VVFAFAVLMSAGMALAPVAQACTQPIQPPVVWVIPHELCCPFDGSPCYIRAWILYHNFVTFPAGPGQFCATSLNIGGPLLGVEGAVLSNAQTGERIAGFSFNGNPTVSVNASGITGGNSVGFLADVSRLVPSGVPADLMFDVRLKEGSLQQGAPDLSNWLLTQGFVVTAEADADGNFDGSHLEVNLPVQVEVSSDGGPPPAKN